MNKKQAGVRFLAVMWAAFTLLSGNMAGGGTAYAAQSMIRELTYGDGQKLYVLLPEKEALGERYPSVYFMPQDGYGARQYLEDGIENRIRALEEEGDIPEMICVFPELRAGKPLEDQIREAIAVVEDHCPAGRGASMRGVTGFSVGGYLSFLLGYGAADGEVDEEPLFFSKIASQDGDFTSRDNPFLGEYGDVYSLLSGRIGGFGADGQWLGNYYTYLDCNADSLLAWAEGGSADIASLFREPGLADENSPSAWDYDVFAYSIRSSVLYGTYLDQLGSVLKNFAHAFSGKEGEGTEETETEYQPLETITEGAERRIDLAGSWYFRTADALRESDPEVSSEKIGKILDTDWREWDVVQPGLDWWSSDFASCLKGNPYYAGYAWYIRDFVLPEGFDRKDLQLEAGMMDEADEIYLNGKRIGQTGIPDEGGSYDGTNPWDVERIYPVPEDLIRPGKNVLAVRICNSNGAGGWYAGPIRITAKADKEQDSSKRRFYTDSFSSDSLKGQEIEYRVFLPEGYDESELRYPVVYMLHGYGSTGKSFEIAGVPAVLDEGIAEGKIPPCIVIFPSDGHPQKQSWWSGAYAKMLNEDLISRVDSTLRTVNSREYRFLAGESMGGGGAYLNALAHPELYGGVFDIYGALRYTGALKTFLEMDAGQLGQFRHVSICGSHDLYCFDLDHIRMGGHLTRLKVPHLFEIDSGEHSSSFYLPRLKDGFAYLLAGVEPVRNERE